MLHFLALLQEHGAAPQGGEPHVATPFDINAGLIIWTIIVFGILLALLWWLAWPTLVKSVEEREQRIAKQLADAEAANAQAQKLLEEHKAAIAKARTEAQDIIANAKGIAQKERDALLAKSHEEQEQMLERARREIGAERDKALVALRREAVDLSIAAASKLVESNLDSDANRKLVTEYLAGLDKK
jgi:F-type H+-transporting ATPase subunit b